MDAKMGQTEEALDLHLYTAAEELFRRRMVEESVDGSDLAGSEKVLYGRLLDHLLLYLQTNCCLFVDIKLFTGSLTV
ncbi:hypothetical protein HanXRQr2_Chr10g0455311 [Helianthus annuus]|uniref:Uncharacterized protein n=1 Tax=Helianthus annuus TaxID=4232 RepID=A0A9K3HZN8_HELAN|nr:hypothetical protein HanXRQr2_Chr10g0455311 [Helianthus annuus]KAJ0514866.1 hypothetical protein HanHA300_Chr10g0374381 [Helianthus annuus]KAJ0531030.1 hypothetical protein HanHA89_Chr10g0396601 [Helianthus annuus]KAJ0884951.1 hypothetical protein HanPSC8_Chr10g0439751 [Helianthus annuus]